MTAARKLTAISLPNLPEGDYPDPMLPGLTFRVRKRRRIWTIRHRVGGKQRRDTIGFYPKMGMADARAAARGIAERVDAGAPIEAAPVHPRQGGLSLGQMIDQYEVYRRAKGERIKTLDDALRTVRTNLAAYLKLPAKAFTKADLREVRDTIHERAPDQASRFLSYCGPVFRWGAGEDHIEVNFVPAVIKIKGVTKRERVLDQDEIRKFWWATFEMVGPAGPGYARLLRFLLVSSARLDEAASLRYRDIIDGQWKLEDNKSDRPLRLRLPQLALDQLGKGEPTDLCFVGKGGKKLSGYSKLKVKLDKLAGIAENWTQHDLRRSSATGMKELGVDPTVIDAVQNHAIVGVAGHYQHAQMLGPKAAALAVWADALALIIQGKQAWVAA